MVNHADLEFLSRVEQQSEESLKDLVNQVYAYLSKDGYRASFGVNGSKEFVAAVILFYFDLPIQNFIGHGFDEIFNKKWSPLMFSNFMDEVIEKKSVISYPCWSEAIRYLHNNHKWIERHPCAFHEEIQL